MISSVSYELCNSHENKRTEIGFIIVLITVENFCERWDYIYYPLKEYKNNNN